MTTETLTITLPAEMARMIHRQVESGAYASHSEIIGEAVRLWHDRRSKRGRRLDAIRAELKEAADEPSRIGDEELGPHFDERLAEAEKRRDL